ncbi:MAG: polysaccharide deacetylase family protein [Campylobacterota bacterium]|nr:polysaccharide deacetylase family protein [Campylobacterota bacterium]
MRAVINFFIFYLIINCFLFADTKRDGVAQDFGSAVVFMYHRFGDDRYPSTNVTLEQFNQHLAYIQDNGFRVWPLSKIVRYMLEKKQLPDKIVAISVDDAYITTYTNAYPLLKAKNFPFIVFVNTNAIDVESKNYMSWEQMREMALNGAEFANHSLTHAYMLPQKDETKESWKKRFEGEVVHAQKRLHKELGSSTNENPKLFSYPFGEYNQDMKNVLRELNYIGVAQMSGAMDSHSDFGALPRFPMAESFAHKKGFALKINTLPLAIESISPMEPVITSQNPPLLKLKLKNSMKNLNCFRANGEKIQMKWLSKTELELQAKTPLQEPRDRYTCTAPTKDGRWFWYSHMWIVK